MSGRRRDAREIGVKVSRGGKPMNRENITVGHEVVPVRFYRTSDPPIFAGFQNIWVEGEDPDSGARFDLTSGSGWGSKYMTLAVTLPDGRVVYEYVDVTEFLRVRVESILAEPAATPAVDIPVVQCQGDQDASQSPEGTP